jgi:hypothetical protein
VSGSLFFLGSDLGACSLIAEGYATAGWATRVVHTDADDVVEQIVAEEPVAIVFCLDTTHLNDVNSVTGQIIADARLRRPLLVYLDGTPEQNARIKQLSPFAVFVKNTELGWVLKRLVVKV